MIARPLERVSGSLIDAMYRFCWPSAAPGQPDQTK
jgi:hypothetical protein